MCCAVGTTRVLRRTQPCTSARALRCAHAAQPTLAAHACAARAAGHAVRPPRTWSVTSVTMPMRPMPPASALKCLEPRFAVRTVPRPSTNTTFVAKLAWRAAAAAHAHARARHARTQEAGCHEGGLACGWPGRLGPHPATHENKRDSPRLPRQPQHSAALALRTIWAFQLLPCATVEKMPPTVMVPE